mmetsp:Transcript_18927/g.26355  ORF Transcript_18927/g.26355 Transcript_18927/m.26355 type:complete len:331 (-) Transcript_18927:351-1343(-)|eukprot:CAMPEP_0184487740 /NCGR_PEP_ID=MMETSP0113_2-20130426/10308_1 /TAXON_ID=91329 /ORGANISM="Norrisiella sphaerica, Strain BC52" /LENGTH=330 /DNA_ID=CAMNT_0026870137 /DNA_START=153 /DNA_END=1145 /DNA_ORIENTATION=-
MSKKGNEGEVNTEDDVKNQSLSRASGPPAEDVERMKAELEGLREALKVAMETAANKSDEKELGFRKKKKPSASFTKAPSLSIGGVEYFKAYKPCGLCNFSDCCFPALTFKTQGDQTLTIKHGCCCLPCCFNFNYYNSKDKIGYYSLGTMGDAACCGNLIIDGKFFDAQGDRKFLLKHDAACCDCCKISCCGCCYACGGIQCYKYYCSDEQYRLYLQPIYRTEHDVAPVAHFKYVDRVRGPCMTDERISSTIEPCDELTQEDMDILAFYLILTSNYVAHYELGINWTRTVSASPSPYGIESIDTILGIHTKYLDEKDACGAKLINTTVSMQ